LGSLRKESSDRTRDRGPKGTAAEGHGGEMYKGLLQFSKFGAKVLHTTLRRAEESKNATLNGQEE